MYHLIQKQTFIDHFVDLNKDLQRRICKDLEILRQTPNNASSKNIENLGGQRGLWTFRVNDNYRLLYAIAGSFVQLIDVGKHDYIYGLVDRARSEKIADFGKLGEVLDPTVPTTAADIPNWPTSKATRDFPSRTNHVTPHGKLLPMEITPQVLERLEIPEIYRDDLLRCETEDVLLNLGLPEDIFERLCAWL